MAITYPLALPSSPAPRDIVFAQRTAVASASSPFSYAQQTAVWPGQMWTASVKLPPMKRANAEAWLATLAALNGQEGSMILGDTANIAARGTATGYPRVNGASQTGATLATKGWTASLANILRAGDWIQLGGENILKYSEDFTNAIWTKNNMTATAGQTDPWGGTAACLLDAAVGDAFAIQTFTPLNPGPHCFSVWIKAVTGAAFNLTVRRASGSEVVGQLAITPSTSAWTRYEVPFVPYDLTAHHAIIGGFGLMGSTEDVYAYGAQVNLGSTATGYQLTTSATSIITRRLHKVLFDVNSDGSGNVSLSLWPNLRSSPADSAAITIASPKGKFMLASPPEWSIDEAQTYGIEFTAVEDLR